MSKTTITICGEECVILPAPKGAFVDNCGYLDLVPFVAVKAKVEVRYPDVCMYALSHYDGDDMLTLKYKDSYINTEIIWNDLDKFYDTWKKEIIDEDGGTDADMRDFVMDLYLKFSSHGTHFTPSAIEWFREKFKEHNITKADFDVFA